jgi:tRNA nucleotidyltransferase (CCA-adding enzyme)
MHMNMNEYLQHILATQNLAEDSAELRELQNHRAAVEKLLCNSFGSRSIIRYGGSKAKGTLIKEYYDLDIVCYFPWDCGVAGKTLAEIYDSVRKCLANSYFVEEKTSALRLKGRSSADYMRDFHIDVVPGRFTDDMKSDCFIYQKSAEKCRLKTNLDTHVSHVKESEVVDTIRLLKLWKTRRGLKVKQFAFELLIIDFLEGWQSKPISDQLLHFWAETSAHADPLHVEDPANPAGNDLSDIMSAAWPALRAAASETLDTIKWSGWEAVFGRISSAKSLNVTERAQRAAASVSTKDRPWCPQE